MCIAYSVGRGGRNEWADVAAFQVLFNLNHSRYTDGRPVPDAAAIEAFETRVMGLPYSDGIVAPGDSTMQAPLAGLPPGATKENLNWLFDPASGRFVSNPALNAITARRATTPRRGATR